jgi:hypothetical protein
MLPQARDGIDDPDNPDEDRHDRSQFEVNFAILGPRPLLSAPRSTPRESVAEHDHQHAYSKEGDTEKVIEQRSKVHRFGTLFKGAPYMPQCALAQEIAQATEQIPTTTDPTRNRWISFSSHTVPKYLLLLLAADSAACLLNTIEYIPKVAASIHQK